MVFIPRMSGRDNMTTEQRERMLKGLRRLFAGTLLATYAFMNGTAYHLYNSYEEYSKPYTAIHETPPRSEKEHYLRAAEDWDNITTMILAPVVYIKFKSNYNDFLERYQKEHPEMKKTNPENR